MNTYFFRLVGSGYKCDKPEDQTGHYVPVGELRDANAKIAELESQLRDLDRLAANERLVRENDELRAQLAMESARLDWLFDEHGWKKGTWICFADFALKGESFREAIDAARLASE